MTRPMKSRDRPSVHMGYMKIVNINPRYVGQVEIALLFETDRRMYRAFEYLVSRGHLDDFSYRPETEGEDEDRALIAVYLHRRNSGNTWTADLKPTTSCVSSRRSGRPS